MRLIARASALLFLLAACAPSPSMTTGEAEPATLIVAVTGLDHADPVLARLGRGLHRAEDVLATGMGASAVLELVGGKTALAQLQEPGRALDWADTAGLPLRIDLLDPALRSSPDWVRAGLDFETPDLLPRRAATGLHLLILPRARVDRASIRALLDLAGDDLLVVVAGVPDAPRPDDGPAPGGDASDLLARLRVPVLAAGRDADRLVLDGRRTLGMVLDPLHGQAPEPSDVRVATWWNHRGGGMLVEAAHGTVAGGSHRSTVWVSDPVRDEAPEPVLAAHAPSGDLLVLVRGSEGADLTSLDFIFDEKPEWSGWGLEPIDRADATSPRYLRLDLAAEPEGDGIRLHHWTGQGVDIRVNIILEEAPWIGTPIRDAASGRWLGVNSLRLAPWSRDWWILTRGPAFDAADWAERTSAGVDLLWVDAKGALPVPVRPDR